MPGCNTVDQRRGRFQTCPYNVFLTLLLTCLLTGVQSHAGIESIPVSSSRSITPVKLISVTTATGYGVKFQYGEPCVVEEGTRLRKLEHNFGKKGFVLVQYRTPYTEMEGHCPSGTLFFLPEKEAAKKGR
jgi:hypothetical protein